MTRRCFIFVAGVFGCVAVALAGERDQRTDARSRASSHPPAGVLVIHRTPVTPDDLPVAPATFQRARVREVRRADGTGLAHLDGQVLEASTARVIDGRVHWRCSAAGPRGGRGDLPRDFRGRSAGAQRVVR